MRFSNRHVYHSPTHEAVPIIKTPYHVLLLHFTYWKTAALVVQETATGGVRVSHDVQTRIVDVTATTFEFWPRKEVHGVIRFYGRKVSPTLYYSPPFNTKQPVCSISKDGEGSSTVVETVRGGNRNVHRYNQGDGNAIRLEEPIMNKRRYNYKFIRGNGVI